ncbi:aminotransferase class I/II-fold pyridoxal phosphate-dependent enzyme [Caldicellulosiruptoraceae bacterium PP1]
MDFSIINKFYKIDKQLIELSEEAYYNVQMQFGQIEKIKNYNQLKVLKSFQENKVCDVHFSGTTGYGYSDVGRDTIEKIYSSMFKTQDSLVRIQFVSGTQALSTMLFGVLRPQDTLLSITGSPYDTLLKVIGLKPGGNGTLMEYGINYKQIELINNDFDYDSIRKCLLTDKSIKAIFIQRSRGYTQRRSLDINQIENICKNIKEYRDDVVILVDNCYGEFTDISEPSEVGADLIGGSLIKNPGGTIALTGGYISGRKDLVEKCADRLFSPGMGKETGPSLGFNRYILQGLFYAPHIVAESLKISVWSSYLLEKLGFSTSPKYNEKRSDIVQSITFYSEKKLIEFCKGIQQGCPIDSIYEPEPWDMPGYSNQVIMAAGSFVQGASLELSCDAPIKEPYTAYLQGGWNFESGVIGILIGLQRIRKMC